MTQLTPTILLAIGCLLVLLFLFWPLFLGPAGPFERVPRWVFLTDGVGMVLWSRAFASEATQPGLLALGSVLVLGGVYLTWRSIGAHVRTKAVERAAGTSPRAPL
jgi:hypothetical protein